MLWSHLYGKACPVRATYRIFGNLLVCHGSEEKLTCSVTPSAHHPSIQFTGFLPIFREKWFLLCVQGGSLLSPIHGVQGSSLLLYTRCAG